MINPLETGVLMTNTIQLSVTFIQDVFVILKHSLQNYTNLEEMFSRY